MKDHSEQIEEFEEEQKRKETTHKIFVCIMAIFMISLMMSYVILPGHVRTIIEGQFESIPVQNNKILDNNVEIIFEGNTTSILESIYINEQELKLVETSMCLKGRIIESEDKKQYFVNEIYYPEIYEQSFRHVNFESCPIDTVIMLHSHPYKNCIASETDLDTLKKVKKSNPNILMMIMCEEQRYSVYG